MYLSIFSCLECIDCAVTFATHLVSHAHLFCSSVASSTSSSSPDSFTTSSLLRTRSKETAIWPMNSPQTTIKWCTERSPRTVALFISNSPGCFRAYWFDLSSFSRILFCLQTNILGSQICSTYAESLLNCLCPLHAFTHEHHQKKKAQPQFSRRFQDQRKVTLLMCCGILFSSFQELWLDSWIKAGKPVVLRIFEL